MGVCLASSRAKKRRQGSGNNQPDMWGRLIGRLPNFVQPALGYLMSYESFGNRVARTDRLDP